MSDKQFLCLHGHFYQPPREDPWLEEIELQRGAAPYHDWNERIYHECYKPNSRARVLNKNGQIVDVVNNYEKLSFNFGPTLFEWLQAKHPETYHAILEADRKSVEAHKGHGNAIAQAYNHMILPLANRRDKVTQVRWGLADFRHRFQRDPESMWLPETACNEETLEVLIEEGLRYILLDPRQAQTIRSLAGGEEVDVGSGQIDTRRCYRCFLKKDSAKFIDIFFYNGAISHAVGFEDALINADHFMEYVDRFKTSGQPDLNLIHVAVDGETYGHHKSYGDRVIAYVMNVEARQRGFAFINYGEYLEAHPPTWAVTLKEGEKGEGSSWSCAHGVARWQRNCGCRTAGPPEWNQEWRAPLRDSLNWLRDELGKIFEEVGSPLLKNVWTARNEYIRIILDRSRRTLHEFFASQAKKELSAEEKIVTLKLLEMQRQAMFMFTSCGWFFSEISGIETIQILKHAAKALKLAPDGRGGTLEKKFLERLSQAKSNLTRWREGRKIYEKKVKPKIITLANIAGFYGITSIFDGGSNAKTISFYCYEIDVLHKNGESFGDITMILGHVRVLSKITWEKSDFIFISVRTGLYDFRCSVKPFPGKEELDSIEKQFFGELHSLHTVELVRMIDSYFGKTYFALKDLPLKERTRIIESLTKAEVDKISAAYEAMYNERRRMIEIYRSIDLPIPTEIRYAVEHVLGKMLTSSVRELENQGFDAERNSNYQHILEEAESFEVNLDTSEIQLFLSRGLTERMKQLSRSFQPRYITECRNIMKLAEAIGVALKLSAAQDHLFNFFKKWDKNHPWASAITLRSMDELRDLAAALSVNSEKFK